ncbi:MAG: cytochrome c biogenesis protein CcsA [Planctomycetota bacterium]
MQWLHQISITCFATSYTVVFLVALVGVLRSGRSLPAASLLGWIMLGLGLFTHTTYLLLQRDGPTLWASWSEWSMLTALLLALSYAIGQIRRPDTIVGVFFLPVILALIALGIAIRDVPPFDQDRAVELWRIVHAAGMAAGTTGVMLGFIAGVMFLVQARRLKRHRAGSKLRLPTLETLSRANRQSLVFSTVSVAIGVLAGVVMNINRWGNVGWVSGGVLLSSLLLLWLVAATLMEYFYEPASRGRKAVYLTVASFGFLVLAIGSVMTTDHGQGSQPERSTPATAVSSDSGGAVSP